MARRWTWPARCVTHPRTRMKIPRLLTAAALALGAGCSSLDNPLANLTIFHTGRDARTFNPQTGEYEWPKDATPRPAARTPRRPAAAATPAPGGDGRYYDPMRGGFTDPEPAR